MSSSCTVRSAVERLAQWQQCSAAAWKAAQFFGPYLAAWHVHDAAEGAVHAGALAAGRCVVWASRGRSLCRANTDSGWLSWKLARVALPRQSLTIQLRKVGQRRDGPPERLCVPGHVLSRPRHDLRNTGEQEAHEDDRQLPASL
jgi:hypothetical protein